MLLCIFFIKAKKSILISIMKIRIEKPRLLVVCLILYRGKNQDGGGYELNNQNDENGSYFKSAASLKIIISLLALRLMGGLMIAIAVTRAVENTSMTDTSYEDIDGSYPPDTSVSGGDSHYGQSARTRIHPAAGKTPGTASRVLPKLCLFRARSSNHTAETVFSTPRHWISISAIRPLTFRRLPAVRSAL